MSFAICCETTLPVGVHHFVHVLLRVCLSCRVWQAPSTLRDVMDWLICNGPKKKFFMAAECGLPSCDEAVALFQVLVFTGVLAKVEKKNKKN